MTKFLGEEIININQTPFKGYTKTEWIQYFLNRYMCIDGSHHKQWLLNEILKLTLNTEVIIKLARWDNGHTEWRVNLDIESNEYTKYLNDNYILIEDIQGIAP